jgi:hypothetical protein
LDKFHNRRNTKEYKKGVTIIEVKGMGRYFIIRFFALAFAFSAPVYFSYASSEYLNVDDDALYSSKLPDSITIDSIAVHKANREMLVFSKNRLVKIYRIHLGKNAVGPKQVSGDYKKLPKAFITLHIAMTEAFFIRVWEYHIPTKRI